MSKATENLEAAQERAMATRPKGGGFPFSVIFPRETNTSPSHWC
jgi:hypothetical protein